LTSTLTKSRPRREANTYNLPRGDALRRALKAWFRRQRKAVVDYLRTGDVAETKNESIRGMGGNHRVQPRFALGNHLDLEQRAIVAEVEGRSRLSLKREPGLPGAWPDWDDFQLGSLAMSQRMTPYIRAIWDQQGKKFTSKIGLDPDEWSVTNPHTQAAIDKATLAFCKATQDTTDLQLDEALERTRSALTAGLVEHGESLLELTKRVKEIFTGAETWRARRIAGTESSRATHQAQIMAATDSQVVTGFEWLLSDDSCAYCQTVARRAGRVKLGQAFAVVGDNPNYARIESPPLHPN
jgi:hypothetical protein